MEKFRDKKILVSGAGGFVGSYLCDSLKERCNLTALVFNKEIRGVKFIFVDITKKDDVLKIKDHYDLIFHVAGLIQKPGNKPEDYFNVNTIGIANILELCEQNKIKNLILSSTVEVYGKPQYFPVDENHSKIPENYYGMSKLLAEDFCKEYTREHKIDLTILRYSYIQGQGQFKKRVVSVFINNAINGKDIVINGSGKDTYDFVDIHDVVEANLLAAFNKKAKYQVFNIAAGKEMSINELAEIIKELVNPKIKIKHNHMNEGKPKRFVFDISKARTLIDYIPRYTIVDSLKEMIDNIGDRYE